MLWAGHGSFQSQVVVPRQVVHKANRRVQSGWG